MNDDNRQLNTIECSHVNRRRESSHSHCLQRLIEHLLPPYWPDLQKQLQDLIEDKSQQQSLEAKIKRNNTCYTYLKKHSGQSGTRAREEQEREGRKTRKQQK